MRAAYHSFCARSRQRGRVVNLKYKEWFQWWIDSGHLAERGHAEEQYCMNHIDKSGPTDYYNIECITNKERGHKEMLNNNNGKRQ